MESKLLVNLVTMSVVYLFSFLLDSIRDKLKLQVRKYAPFIVVETDADKLAASSGFNAIAG